MNKNTAITVLYVLSLYSYTHLNAETTFAEDAASFFKIKQAIEKKGLEHILTNEVTTQKAQIIIAEAQKFPSFIMAMQYPEIDSYWLAFEDALARLILKHQGEWSQPTATRRFKQLLSTEAQIKQQTFEDNVQFYEIFEKVTLNFQLARKLALQRTQ